MRSRSGSKNRYLPAVLLFGTLLFLIHRRENNISLQLNSRGVSTLFTVAGVVAEDSGMGGLGDTEAADLQQHLGIPEGIEALEQEINGSAK